MLAALASWNVGRDAEAVVPVLLDLLEASDLQQPLHDFLDLCEVGPGASAAVIPSLEYVEAPDQAPRTIMRVALREIGEPAVRPLADQLGRRGDAMCREVSATLAAISLAAGTGVLDREAARVDHDLGARRWLTNAQHRREELEKLARRFELFTMSLPRVPRKPAAILDADRIGKIDSATWLHLQSCSVPASGNRSKPASGEHQASPRRSAQTLRSPGRFQIIPFDQRHG